MERTIPCCIEAPASFITRARYALSMLLKPLGFDPEWIRRDALSAGALYYGTAPEEVEASVVAMPLRPETVVFFDGDAPYRPGDVHWQSWDGEEWPVLFGGPPPEAPDLVASTFFWLSGWQEYSIRARDRHGRFPYAASLHAHWDLAHRPVVDVYRELLAERLARSGVVLNRRTWKGHPWALCPTHDIDYLRKWRPGMVWREAMHYLVLNHRNVSPAERIDRFRQFLRSWIRPGDAFRHAFVRMQAETEAREGRATYFLKAGAHGPHDVPYALGSHFLRTRVAALQEAGFEIGLHPSYHAGDHAVYLHDEVEALTHLIGRRPRSVRQHYLRYHHPLTPRLQQEAGFEIDSTLGFSEHEGFRNATCLPFQVFDLQANRVLDVWEMPLAAMESALFNRRDLGPDAAFEALQRLMDACARFGGACVVLWHNTLWDELDYPGWGEHFVRTLDTARNEGALIASLAEAFEHWQPARKPSTA